ncbi:MULTISPECIES: hypothetical protein [unclassified Streptomyces]|uniref:hypothetical protein n=1 Tax=Streptomyces sp. NPDC127129 TaxID=3345373 RepID=UPI0036326328
MTREPDGLADALSAALRREQDGADTGEARARAAYRAARDAEANVARRTRRRDDWRPAPVRGRWRGSLRTTAFGVAATVLLGGVAVAASGTLDPAPPAPPAPAPAPEAPETFGTSESPGTPGPTGASDAGRSASATPTSRGEVRDGPSKADGKATTKGEAKGKAKGEAKDRTKGRSVHKDAPHAESTGASTGEGTGASDAERNAESYGRSSGKSIDKGEKAAGSKGGNHGVNGPRARGRTP